MRRPLGEMLLSHALLAEATLEHALAIARNTRTRLGEVLIGEGLVGYRDLYELLARQQALPFANLLEDPPAPHLLDKAYAEDYLHMRCVPWKRDGDTLVLATSELNNATLVWAQSCYGPNIRFVMTSPRDIHLAVQRSLSHELTRKSILSLYEKAPEQSARRQPVRSLRLLALLSTLLVGVWWLAAGWSAMLVVLAACNILYALSMFFKAIIYLAGAAHIGKHEPQELMLDDAVLPVYTVLIPMYREAESLPGMMAAMQAMDYPQSKLDIKLVCEADDTHTIAAAERLKPNYNFEIIRVPPSAPRTKPKACNYALRFARGEYVTVYDADDRPEPQQLRKAVAAFRQAPADVICLQARLNYYNTHDNWLTRLFSLEYALLFHVLLYGLQRLHMPLMLGGTSNHIYLSRLIELGEWDPFNVTEDADLGTRLAARGYKTRMLDSDTLEEAPNTFKAWLSQRTRWIKGYMQTWLVHMRHPVMLLHSLKPRGFIGFQCFVALSSFSYLTAPLSWAIAFSWLLVPASLPNWLYGLAMLNLFANLTIHIATALHVTMLYHEKRSRMALAALSYPIYLVLHSIASYVALWQLIVKPYVWNKTTHGKAKTFVDFRLTRAGQPS